MRLPKTTTDQYIQSELCSNGCLSFPLSGLRLLENLCLKKDSGQAGMTIKGNLFTFRLV